MIIEKLGKGKKVENLKIMFYPPVLVDIVDDKVF
jgi:hypothetical protein